MLELWLQLHLVFGLEQWFIVNMIPPRPTKPILPPRPTSNRIQLNRLFDNEEEMKSYISAQYPGATIKRFWPVHNLACIIELPEKKPEVKGKK